MGNIYYAKGPIIYLYDRETLKKKKKQLLWGDWLRIGDSINDKWSEITWGTSKLAVKKSDYQEQRICELIFLDVGQGDGCILTTPDDSGMTTKTMIVDAGIGDNMNGYLKWRFRDFRKKFKFHAAVLTHPDSDHYRGFQKIFDNKQISFKHVYHNGIMERDVGGLLGPVKNGFLTGLCKTKTAAKNLYKDELIRGSKWYPKLIWTALTSDRFDDVSMLSTKTGKKENGRTWMPGFAPSNNKDFTIEVLGPVVQKTPSGVDGLKTFGASMSSTSMDKGKTKNGHSIILRLQYHDFSILFGGDLNTPAEHHLIRHYGNNDKAPTTVAETEAMLAEASKRFGVDVLKCCHHGSSDVTDEFLESTGAAAFVVSSGDEESHVHPRPDLLGLLGKKGRGSRPLVLCTEILRSTREKESKSLRKDLEKIDKKLQMATTADERKLLQKTKDKLLDKIFKRNVGVYGAINVRTDGHRAVIAFRREKPRGINRWFYYELEKDEHGNFQVPSDVAH